MARRANKPDGASKRAAVYLRVSSEDQVDGYSLAAQERAVTAFCDQHSWKIVARYLEPGRSARSDDERQRPVFHQMMSDAEAGAFDAVIVHKLDRFARNRRVAFDAFHRLGAAGVGFVSIGENMDYSTPAGQLMLTMLVGMAQFYSDNLSFETKKGKTERKRQGMYNGLLPFGAAKGPGGVPVLDTTARYCVVATRKVIVPGEGLVLAFELAAAGQTDREIARALNDAGYRTSGNRGMNPFTKDSVRVILRNRFYLGELPDGAGGWLPGKHGALIDPDLFARAESARIRNTRAPREVSTKRTPWALSGVAICGACGANVTANHGTAGRRRVRCSNRTQGGDCREVSAFAAPIVEQIGALLHSFAVPETEQARLLDLWRAYDHRTDDTAAERKRLEGRLARLKVLYLDGDIDEHDYRRQRDEIAEQLAALPSAALASDAVGQRLAAFLADVSRAWEVATEGERNRIARELFAKVVISNGAAVAIVPRPELRPFFMELGVNREEYSGGSDGIRTRDLSLDRAAC